MSRLVAITYIDLRTGIPILTLFFLSPFITRLIPFSLLSTSRSPRLLVYLVSLVTTHTEHQRMYAIQPAVEDYQTNNFICRNRLAIRKGIDGARLHSECVDRRTPVPIHR